MSGTQAPSRHVVRCEWGPQAVAYAARDCSAVVVVDILSFTTSVDLAAGCGAVVLPHPARDGGAAAFASARDACLAGENAAGWSLRPASLERIPRGTRLVLPSPNGAAVSFALAAMCVTAGRPRVFAGCLRNRHAVAEALRMIGGPVCVIPAGERWPSDGSLRPCIEDLLGAGAFVAALAGERSPEARVAEAAFRAHERELDALIRGSVSGLEKLERGHARDVDLATLLDVSAAVPELVAGEFHDRP